MTHSPQPEPLPAGTVLLERFTVLRVLGRGGFGIVYECRDGFRNDLAAVKELAPEGLRRRADDGLDMPTERVRQRFEGEGRRIARVSAPGILRVRGTWTENGTAYLATDHVAGAETLERRLERGPMDLREWERLARQTLQTLQTVHEAGILHRDLKPSNVLLDASGRAYLIDFGAAREWLGDSSGAQTSFFTPGYAAPEQLSDLAARGPGTDLYSLAATLFEAATGRRPPSFPQRLEGATLGLAALRPDMPPSWVRAVESSLALPYGSRPESAAQMRAMLDEPIVGERSLSADELDEMGEAVRAFRFDRRACPSCGGVLLRPKPLRAGRCPVCRTGSLTEVKIPANICPICRDGRLVEIKNHDPIRICPYCRQGRLAWRLTNLLRKERAGRCESCGIAIIRRIDGAYELPGGETTTEVELRMRSQRAATVHACKECMAQFDPLTDGRWRLVGDFPNSRYRDLYPAEWSQVAVGRAPGAGNVDCQSCGADYFRGDGAITLLEWVDDPYRFAAHYGGRRLPESAIPWLSVGKQSPHPGYRCETCELETDHEGPYERLVSADRETLARHEGQSKTLEDWHRIGRQLPETANERELPGQLESAIRASYDRAEWGFGGDPSVVWDGPAALLPESEATSLRIDGREISFGGRFRRRRIPITALLTVRADGAELWLACSGMAEELGFEIEPMALEVSMRSRRKHTVELGAEDVARRLQAAGR